MAYAGKARMLQMLRSHIDFTHSDFNAVINASELFQNRVMCLAPCAAAPEGISHVCLAVYWLSLSGLRARIVLSCSAMEY